MDGRLHARIENIGIRGFRSLADVKLEGLPPVAVLIGANGSGKPDVILLDEPELGLHPMADFLYVWLKRTAGHIFPELFLRKLTDKENEAVAPSEDFASACSVGGRGLV